MMTIKHKAELMVELKERLERKRKIMDRLVDNSTRIGEIRKELEKDD